MAQQDAPGDFPDPDLGTPVYERVITHWTASRILSFIVCKLYLHEKSPRKILRYEEGIHLAKTHNAFIQEMVKRHGGVSQRLLQREKMQLALIEDTPLRRLTDFK